MHWAPQMANCMLSKFNLIFFLFKYHWEKEMGEYGKDETSFLWRAQDSIYQKKKKKED